MVLAIRLALSFHFLAHARTHTTHAHMKLYCTFEMDIIPGAWASDAHCKLSKYLKHPLGEQCSLNTGYFNLVSVFFHIRQCSQGALLTTLAELCPSRTIHLTSYDTRTHAHTHTHTHTHAHKHTHTHTHTNTHTHTHTNTHTHTHTAPARPFCDTLFLPFSICFVLSVFLLFFYQ